AGRRMVAWAGRVRAGAGIRGRGRAGVGPLEPASGDAAFARQYSGGGGLDPPAAGTTAKKPRAAVGGWREGVRMRTSRDLILASSWKASIRFYACIGTRNPPLTPPRRGTDRTRTNVCSPPRRGRGWVGSLRV